MVGQCNTVEHRLKVHTTWDKIMDNLEEFLLLLLPSGPIDSHLPSSFVAVAVPVPFGVAWEV